MALPLSYALIISVAGSTNASIKRCDTGIGLIERVAAMTVSLPHSLGNASDASTHILSWRNHLKVVGILAGRVTAKVISVLTLRGPLPKCQEKGNAVRRYRPVMPHHRDLSIPERVFRR